MKQNMYWLKMNGISYQRIVKLISIKGLTKDLINKYKILNGRKYFSSGILQNYSLLVNTLNILVAPMKSIYGKS